jgi:D-mannonate dehydratase
MSTVAHAGSDHHVDSVSEQPGRFFCSTSPQQSTLPLARSSRAHNRRIQRKIDDAAVQERYDAFMKKVVPVASLDQRR